MIIQSCLVFPQELAAWEEARREAKECLGGNGEQWYAFVIDALERGE